jgi:hypothetical protein
MPETCWCGEELITGFVMVDDGKGGMEKAPLDAEPRCPVHGEDCVWRECKEAGPLGYTRGTFEVGGTRCCNAHPSGGTRYHTPESCKRCDRPALVAAVEAGIAVIERIPSPGHIEDVIADGGAPYGHDLSVGMSRTLETMRAALAAMEEANWRRDRD